MAKPSGTVPALHPTLRGVYTTGNFTSGKAYIQGFDGYHIWLKGGKNWPDVKMVVGKSRTMPTHQPWREDIVGKDAHEHQLLPAACSSETAVN